MPKHLLRPAVVLLIATAAGCASKPTTQPAATAPPVAVVPDEAKMAATEAALARPVPQLGFNMVAIEEVLAFLSETTGVPIEADWTELAKVGVLRTDPITMRLRSVKLNKFIKVVFESVSSQAGEQATGDVVYEIRPDGNLRVTTWQDVFDRTGSTKRYPIGDLLIDATPDQRYEAKESYRSEIVETIAVDSWAELPGKHGGTAAFEGDTIVVSQTADVQKKVASLLETLRVQRLARHPGTQPTR